MKRVFALVLCLCMVLAMVPAASAAELGNVSVNGTAYNTVEEALAAASAGDTITLQKDLSAGQIIVPKDVTLNLNGFALTADMLIVFNGAVTGGEIVVEQNLMKIIGDNNGNLPVWNADKACYTFASVNYQQMMQVAPDLSYANYIFVPNLDAATTALLADGGADNGISVKVLLNWNNGQSQQIYTFSEEMVATVYGSANANGVLGKVFQLTITGFDGITDMTACAVVEATAGGKAANDASKVALPEPEPEPTVPETTEPTVPETEPTTPAEPVISEVVLTVDSLGIASQSYTAGTKNVGGVDFEWVQIGNYGNGIQVRDKDGKTSMLWNTSAAGVIKEIRLVANGGKTIYNNPDCAIYSFGNEVDNYTYETKLSTVSGVTEYVITPDGDYTFFKFEHDLGYTQYWDSITIVFAEEAEAPVEPEPTVPETEPTVPETEPTVPETEPTVPETEPTTPVEPAVSEVVLTVDSLGIASQSYTAGTKNVGGIDFEWVQIGNYGNGIQVRDKDGKTSMLWNTSAAGVIKEIRLVANGGKTIYNNPNCAIYSFGNEVDNYTYQTTLSTVSGVTEYVITPDGDYTFFKFEHDLGYTQYWDSITIVFAEEAEAPVEPEPTVPETEPTVPETEPTIPETEPTVPETEPTTPAEPVTETFNMEDYKISGELGGAAFSRNLGDKAVFNISSGWFTSEARIYKNQNGVIASTVGMSSVTLNIGYTKSSTCNVYISEDGATWTEYQMDVPFGADYADVTFDFANPVNYVKIDAPNAQVRIKTISITFVGGASEPSEPEATEPTVPETEPTVPETEPTTPVDPPAAGGDYSDQAEIMEQIKALAAGESISNVTLTGEITKINTAYDATYKNVTVTIQVFGTEDTLKCYRIKGDAASILAVGDTITVNGVVKNYQHSSGDTELEFDAGSMITEHIPAEGGSTEPSEPTVPETNDPAADSVLTVEQVLALGATKEHNAYTTGKYYVTGEITEVYNTTYGNMKIKDAAGNILTIYGTYSADGSARYDAMDVKPVVGDTVTIYGVVGQYNGTPQVKNGWITEHIPAEGGATEPEATEPTVPETEPTTPVEPAASEIVLTVDSLGIASQSYTASTKNVGGVDFEWVQIGNYGNGIQVRDKDGKTSMLWNTSAAGVIKEIRLVANGGKTIYNNPNCAIYSFGNEVDNYTYQTTLSTVSGVTEYVITPDGDYTFFKFEHDLGYTQYWDSITIVFAD